MYETSADSSLAFVILEEAEQVLQNEVGTSSLDSVRNYLTPTGSQIQRD